MAIDNNRIGLLRNPFSRILLGTAFLISGVFLFSIAQYDQEFFGLFCNKKTGFWCGAIRVALFDLGFEGLAYVLVILGAVLIVLYDFVGELLGYILSFALNHVANASNVVIDAMESGRMTRDESSAIIRSTIARYKGHYDERSNSFGGFLSDMLIRQNEIDGGFWRGDFRTNIEVRKLSDHDLDSEKFLRWDETQKFLIFSATNSGTYKYSSASSCEVATIDEAMVMLSHLKYDVLCNGETKFSFDSIREQLTKEVVGGQQGFSKDGLSIKYIDKELVLNVEFDIPISQKETDVVVDEESFISIDDTAYELSFFEPTKGFNFRFALPEDFKIYHEGVSGQRFGTKRSDKVLLKKSRDNQVRIDGTSWALPGIITVLVWKSPNL